MFRFSENITIYFGPNKIYENECRYKSQLNGSVSSETAIIVATSRAYIHLSGSCFGYFSFSSFFLEYYNWYSVKFDLFNVRIMVYNVHGDYYNPREKISERIDLWNKWCVMKKRCQFILNHQSDRIKNALKQMPLSVDIFCIWNFSFIGFSFRMHAIMVRNRLWYAMPLCK